MRVAVASAIWTREKLMGEIEPRGPHSVRPELVEGLPFLLTVKREGHGFDRLSPNGV
jgi:hypothetical protein